MKIYYVITHVKHLITKLKFGEYVIQQLLFNMLNSRFFFFPQNLVILVHFFTKIVYMSQIGFLLVTKR